MQRHILITGGAGFIGSHLADELLRRGCRVRVLDNLSPQVHGADRQRPAYLDDRVELVVGDVRDRAAVDQRPRRGRRRLPLRRRGRGRPEHVPDRGVHLDQQRRYRRAHGGARRQLRRHANAGPPPGGRLEHERLRRGSLSRRARPAAGGSRPGARAAEARRLGGPRRRRRGSRPGTDHRESRKCPSSRCTRSPSTTRSV